MKKFVIALRVLAFLVCGAYVALPIASWIGLRISGETINIHWTFWMGLGLTAVLLIVAEEIKGRTKHESQAQ